MGLVINVSKARLKPSGEIKPGWNGEPEYQHLFATAEHSLSYASDRNTKEVLEKITEAFPSPLYKISITQWSKTGETINAEDILNPETKEV